MEDHEVLLRLETRFQSKAEAEAWYQTQPLPGFSGHTAVELVAQGRADEVLTYIHAVDAGVYS